MTVKILIIHPTDPFGPRVGGAETLIKDFIKFAPDDFKIEFIGISSNIKTCPVKQWKRLKLGKREFNFLPLFFEKNENKKTIVPLSLRFAVSLKFSRINISDRVLFFNRLEPAISFKKSKEPKIGVVHSDIQEYVATNSSEVTWSNFPWLYHLFERLIIPSLNHIYSTSRNRLRIYQSLYPKVQEKLSFLPVWANRDIFYPIDEPKISIRKKLTALNRSIPFDGKWLIFVGRLQKVKAPKRLINSFIQYRRKLKNSNAHLIIAGEGNLRDAVERYAINLGIKNIVHLLGSIEQNLLARFYRASDVLLVTSNFETGPMSVLEALACGIPVVTTNVGEVRRVVKSGFSGEIVESFSPEIIAQTIEKVLANPTMYTKENCIKSVSGYTPREVLKYVYELIRKLYVEKCVS